ncbi:MAG TPA: hypothetical protein VGP93_12065 [Polyangiaceae bacterium]|nr:hypothetical protein [Polyangiaceae bacterium]
MPSLSHAFIVDCRSYGFFSDDSSVESKVAGENEPSRVQVEGLTAPLQFFRTLVTSIVTGAQSEQVIVSAYFPALSSDALAHAVDLLLPACRPATLAMVIADKQGWARVACCADVPSNTVAASVAFTKASGGWDDSDPILVEIDGVTFSASPKFRNGRWGLDVAQQTATS